MIVRKLFAALKPRHLAFRYFLKSMELSFKIEDDYLYAHVCGQWEIDTTQKALIEIQAKATEAKLTRILIDCLELSPPQSEMARYSAGETIATIFGPPYKVVVVIKAEIINKFAENVAINRGANFLVVDDLAVGLEWLLSKQSGG